MVKTKNEIDELLKDMEARRMKLMDEAQSIIATCKSRTVPHPTAHKINADGTFIFNGIKHRISINENERIISISFHKFRYNTSEAELANAGIRFSLNDDAIDYCIRKWLQ